jgi:hypothetical protein
MSTPLIVRLITVLAAFAFCAAPVVTAAQSACIGDCGDDGEVTIDEIIRGVAIALDTLPLAECAVLDADGNGEVTVDELIRAVNNALTGCPPTPTPTTFIPAPSFTSSPTLTPTLPATTTPTPTATPTLPLPSPSATSTTLPTATATAVHTPIEGISVASRAAAIIDTSTDVLRVLPDVVAALLGHLPGNGAGGAALVEIPFECSAGNGGVLSCDPQILPPGPPIFTISFSQCMILSSGGAILTVDGAVTATGQQGDSCASLPSMAKLQIDNLLISAESDLGLTTATFSNVTAQASLSCSGANCVCNYDTVALELAGTLSVTSEDADGVMLTSSAAIFHSGTKLLLNVQQYDIECVPLVYGMLVNGGIDFTTDGAGYTLTVEDFSINDDANSGEDLIGISGNLTSPCLGGRITLQTRTLIRIDRGAPCPAEGEVMVASGDNNDLVRYLDPGVEVDLGDDGDVEQTFLSCLDPKLLLCPG